MVAIIMQNSMSCFLVIVPKFSLYPGFEASFQVCLFKFLAIFCASICFLHLSLDFRKKKVSISVHYASVGNFPHHLPKRHQQVLNGNFV